MGHPLPCAPSKRILPQIGRHEQRDCRSRLLVSEGCTGETEDDLLCEDAVYCGTDSYGSISEEEEEEILESGGHWAYGEIEMDGFQALIEVGLF